VGLIILAFLLVFLSLRVALGQEGPVVLYNSVHFVIFLLLTVFILAGVPFREICPDIEDLGWTLLIFSGFYTA
jgi:hypothetical protein